VTANNGFLTSTSVLFLRLQRRSFCGEPLRLQASIVFFRHFPFKQAISIFFVKMKMFAKTSSVKISLLRTFAAPGLECTGFFRHCRLHSSTFLCSATSSGVFWFSEQTKLQTTGFCPRFSRMRCKSGVPCRCNSCEIGGSRDELPLNISFRAASR